MGHDRIVRFRRSAGRATRKDVWLKTPPSPRLLQLALQDFLGGAGTVDFGSRCWVVTLQGTNTFPLHRVLRSSSAKNRQRAQTETPERLIEVFLDLPGSITVTTRFADEFTGVVADGYVALVKRTWRTR